MSFACLSFYKCILISSYNIMHSGTAKVSYKHSGNPCVLAWYKCQSHQTGSVLHRLLHLQFHYPAHLTICYYITHLIICFTLEKSIYTYVSKV